MKIKIREDLARIAFAEHKITKLVLPERMREEIDPIIDTSNIKTCYGAPVEFEDLPDFVEYIIETETGSFLFSNPFPEALFGLSLLHERAKSRE